MLRGKKKVAVIHEYIEHSREDASASTKKNILLELLSSLLQHTKLLEYVIRLVWE